MTYLDEAYRRMKLPISIFPWANGEITIGWPVIGGWRAEQCKTPSYATRAYLKAVNELGGM